MLSKPFDGLKNSFSQLARGHRLILLDVLPDVDEVSE
jgi:hypothetical protein